MAAASTAFESWLCSRLQQLELDEEVFSGYITGILDQEDTSAEDNVEALVEILGEATTVPVQSACTEIVEQWQKKQDEEKIEKEASRKEQIEKTNAAIMAAPAMGNSAASRKTELSEEEKQRKQALLAQFAYESEDEDGEDGQMADIDELQSTQASRIDATLEKLANTNRQVVTNAQRAERDKQQADHAARVTQAKAAREKQLQQQQDRKEKAKQKVQKRERRR